MIRRSSIIQRFEAELLAQYQGSLLPSHLKALAAMKDGRTSARPSMLAQCTACDHRVLVPHSCGHRSGPHGQHQERQLQKRLPGPYFLLTFTLPPALPALAFGEQRTLYPLMIPCAGPTVQPCAHNDKPRQGTPAAIDAQQKLGRTKKSKGKRR